MRKATEETYNSYKGMLTEKEAFDYSHCNIDGALKRASFIHKHNKEYNLYLNEKLYQFGMSYYSDLYDKSATTKSSSLLKGFHCPLAANKYWVLLSVHSNSIGFAYSKSFCSSNKKRLIFQSALLSIDFSKTTHRFNDLYKALNISEKQQKFYADIIDNEYTELLDKLTVNKTLTTNQALLLLQEKYKKKGFIMKDFMKYLEVRLKTTTDIHTAYDDTAYDGMTGEFLETYAEIVKSVNTEITFDSLNMFVIIDKCVYVFILKALVLINTDADLSCMNSVSMILPFLTMKSHMEYNKLVSFIECYSNHNILPIFKIKVHSSFEECRSLFALLESPKILNDNELCDLFGEEKATKPKSKKAKTKAKKAKFEAETEKVEADNATIETDTECESVEEQQEEPQEENEPNSTTIVNTFVFPFHVSFKNYTYFENKRYIIWLIENLYRNNAKFQDLMRDYDYIRILQDIHFDRSNDIKSQHFNIQLFNSETLQKTSVFHTYIWDNEIVSITQLVQMI